MGDDLKACQYCGEMVKQAAIKCRHCHESLTGKKKRKRSRADAGVRKAIDDAATMSLIMAIIGIVVCFPTCIIAVIKGNESKRLALRHGLPVPGGATAGIIIGWAWGLLNLVLIFVAVIFFAVVAGAAASQGR